MRIQHNIMAMNAYRNYNVNNSALAKNLEKLSSGYKINRAGDDAAGLAISEKMRAQITGLETAQKNAKDGISLVQTAEGALTEVHDMLNRMVQLADQAANGTYDEENDRAQLQKEVTSLKEEINRIADSANFNGIKLLDGSLAASTGASSVMGLDGKPVAAGGGNAFSQEITVQSGVAGKDVSLTLKYLDKNGNVKEATISATLGASSSSAGAVASALQNELQKLFGDDYTVSVTGDKLKIEGKNHEDDQTQIISAVQKANGKETTNPPTLGSATAGEADKFEIDFGALSAAASTGKIFEIDGQKFEILTRGQKPTNGVKAIYIDQSSNTLSKDSVAQIAEQLKKYGVDASVVDGDPTKISISKGDGVKGGMTLQIGDSSHDYNQLTFGISDIHTISLGIDGVDISTQIGAQAADTILKDAINMISDVRGGLGAIQNRLDHTINNLGVMQENIQDAESTIRDTDVANEMMAYTKNNILVQSAQAMLAQANQIPQGVLQLLQ